MLVKEACERLWKKTCKPNRVQPNRVLSNRVLSNRVLSKRISNETNLVLSNRIVCNLHNKVNGRVYKSLC